MLTETLKRLRRSYRYWIIAFAVLAVVLITIRRWPLTSTTPPRSPGLLRDQLSRSGVVEHTGIVSGVRSFAPQPGTESVRWKGTLTLPRNGAYEFCVEGGTLTLAGVTMRPKGCHSYYASRGHYRFHMISRADEIKRANFHVLRGRNSKIRLQFGHGN